MRDGSAAGGAIAATGSAPPHDALAGPTAAGAGEAARAPWARSPQAWGWIAAWAAGWALAGVAVAAGIVFTRPDQDLAPVVRISVLFAEVVGFTSLASARLIFPLYGRLPFAVRIALEVLTLFSATVFGSLLIAASQPFFSLARIETVAMVILVNAALAVVVGIALHTYDRMRRQIEHSFLAMREKEAMERQVAIAREVQRELFPRSVPIVTGLEMAGVCLPAIGVGGDYYDFLPLDGEKVGLVIADVSGKGIPAALLMAALQAAVRGLVLPDIPASEMNRRLNEVLFRSTSPSRYATLFFGIYDGRGRTLTYSNAGHNPPLQIGADGHVKLSSGGIPLGVLGDVAYEQDSRPIAPGDVLALYTDGVTEALDPQGLEYGEERLLELLRRHRNRPLEELIQVLLGELSGWMGGGSPNDDVTIVLARGV